MLPQIRAALLFQGQRRMQEEAMAQTGKSNAHLGIHHPFGAKHGTPLAQRPPLAASHAPLAHRLYPRDWRPVSHTLPVADDAPLEERLYPDSIHDVVARHSRGDHSDLQPYTPEPHAAVAFCQMGVRPLDLIGMGWGYGKKYAKFEQHMEHMQFVGNDGKSNFGLTNSVNLLVESPEQLKRYQVESAKYRREYIDRARDELEAQWQGETGRGQSVFPRYGVPSLFTDSL